MSKLPPLPSGLVAIDEPQAQQQAKPLAYPELPGGLVAIAPPQQTPASDSGYATGLARSVAQGLSFGFSDEAEAWLRSKFGSDSYELSAAKIRDEIEAFAKSNPKSALAAELVGAIAVPGMAAAKATGYLARGAGLVGRTATGAGIGAVEGAVTGAGKAESGETANGSAMGGVIGGVIGGAIPIAGAVLRPAAESVGSRLPVIGDHIANTRANRAIREALETDAQVSGHMRPVVGPNGLRASQNAADELENIRFQAAAHQPGDGGSIATHGDEAIKRLAREATAESPAAQAANRRYHVELDDGLQATGARYPHLHAGAPIQSPALEALIQSRPAIAQANRLARREIANAGETYTAGQFSPQHVDQIDRMLGDAIGKAWRAGANNRASNLEAAQRELRDVIETELPELRRIQEQYARRAEVRRGAPDQQEVIRDSNGRVSEVLSAGASAAMGHKLTAARKIAAWLGGGSEKTAEAITQKLLTRFDDRAAFDRVVSQLEAMNPERRRNYLVTFAGVTGAQIGGKTVERNR